MSKMAEPKKMSKQQMMAEQPMGSMGSFHNPFNNMERAIENILEKFYDAEEKDFIETFDKDTMEEDFLDQFFKHPIYDLVVLMNHGDDDSVLAWIETFREKHNMVSACDEEEEEDENSTE